MINARQYAEHYDFVEVTMVRKSESINRRVVGETSFTYKSQGKDKKVKVLNSVIFPDADGRELEDRIVNRLYDVFVGKVG